MKNLSNSERRNSGSYKEGQALKRRPDDPTLGWSTLREAEAAWGDNTLFGGLFISWILSPELVRPSLMALWTGEVNCHADAPEGNPAFTGINKKQGQQVAGVSPESGPVVVPKQQGSELQGYTNKGRKAWC